MSALTLYKKMHWLGETQHASFAVTYATNLENTTQYPPNTTGVIIIPPFGHEYNHSHRALAYLSEQLSIANNCPVLKLELNGMGNASSTIISGGEDVVGKAWVEALNAALLTLQQEHNVIQVKLVGYRTGALVAAYLAKADERVKGLIFWNAYLTGAPFFRDMEMLQSMQAGFVPASNLFDAGGNCFDTQSKAFIEGLNLKLANCNHLESIAFIQPKELPLSKRLVKQLQEQGLNVAVEQYLGNRDFQKPALENKVPHGAIAAILRVFKPSAAELAREQYRIVLVPSQPPTNTLTNEHEQIVVCAKAGMTGVLTRNQDSDTKNLLVLINGGAAHHVGPARLHVNLARALAKQGFNILRIDLSHLGEGANLTTQLNEGINPFPKGYAGDIKVLLDYMQAEFGYSTFALGGLCSAGHNSFNYMRKFNDPRVRSVLLINPMHLYWQQGTPYMRFDMGELSIGAALKAFKTRSNDNTEYEDDTIPIRSGWFGKCKRLLAAVCLRLNSTLSLVKRHASSLPQDIEALNAAGVNIIVMVSQNEPGRALFKNMLGLHYWLYLLSGKLRMYVMAKSDHAFSTQQSQQMLIDQLKAINTKLFFGDAK